MNDFLIKYGAYLLYAPLFLLFGLAFLIFRIRGTKLKRRNFLFKGVTEINYPYWLTQTARRNNKKYALFNFALAIISFLLSWYTSKNFFSFIGALVLGLSFAFLSYSKLNFFFPSSKIRFNSRKMFTILIFLLVVFYLLVMYGQFIFPTYEQDKSLGKLRVIFYMTGTSFFNVLVPLVILTIGKYRNTVASVILLFGFSLLHAYYFLNFLFVEGNLEIEGYVFTFIIAFSITLFLLENIARFMDLKKNTIIS